MSRADEHPETIVEPAAVEPLPAAELPDGDGVDRTDDPTLRELEVTDAVLPAGAGEDAERTQLLDRTEFLGGHTAGRHPDAGETVRLEAGDTSREPQEEATVLGSDQHEGGHTTFLGVHPGATILTTPAAQPAAGRDSRTVRPAGSRTLLDRGDGATVAQPGGRAGEAATRGGDGWRHYEFNEEIAHGGMGRIWRATDVRIRREVAFKELLPEALREPESIERFVEEAQVTGQLEHPGIVPVYELGRQENGTPFYSMKLVSGGTLRDAIQAYHELPEQSGERRLAFARLLRQFVAVCNAVGFAHERGVLHRDLKPLNIMLGDFGETLILDWGMAKVLPATAAGGLDEGGTAGLDDLPGDTTGETTRTELELSQSTMSERRSLDRTHVRGGQSTRRHSVKTDARSAGTETQMGSIMGTPNYMAPEQALGLVDEFDARTDIYSLGAILYEILTGRPPVPRGKITEKLKFIIEGRTEPPRQIDPAISKPIEAVCLKAMARRKDERYPSALALAADVESFLADEPVSVYAEPWHVRARRWINRHRTLVTATAAVAVVMVAAWVAWSAVDRGRVARTERAVRNSIVFARTAAASGALDRADEALSEALGRASAEPELAALAAGVEAQLAHVRQLRQEQTRATVIEHMADAESAIQTSADYAAARTFLAEARAAAGDAAGLDDLRAELARQLEAIEDELAERKGRDAAQAQFERFTALVDRARFHGSLFRGESAEQDTAEAQRLAREALALYGLDGPDALRNPPQHLGGDQVARLREDAYELLLMLSNAEIVLALSANADEQRSAAERALEWIGRAKRIGPQTKSLLLREAGILERLARADELAEVSRAAADTEPSTALDFFLLGETARLSGTPVEALEWYQRALRADPAHFWSMHFSGLCHLLRAEGESRLSPAERRGELQAALASYTSCIAMRPEFEWNYLVRGVVYGLLEAYDEAAADFETALAIDPRMFGVFVNRGYVRGEEADARMRPEAYDAAVADYRQAARLRPDRADPHTGLGELARRRGMRRDAAGDPVAAAALYQQALTELTEAVRLAPGTAKPYQIRADVNNRLGQLDAAMSDYRRAAELERSPGERSRILIELGRLYFHSDRSQPALESFSEAVAADPQNPEAHYYRAEALHHLNQHAAAAEAFSTFLKLSGAVGDPPRATNERERLEPSMLAKAFRMRGELSASRRDYRHAIEDYIRAVERNPNSYESLARRGWAYLTRGAELALADFTDAIALNPNDADHWAGRGYALVQLGRYEEAVRDAAKAAEVATGQIRAGTIGGWILLFNPATIYAEAIALAEQDRSLTSDERRQRAEEYARRALELLQRAAQTAGEQDRQRFLKQLHSDPALEPLRRRPEFQEAWGSTGN